MDPLPYGALGGVHRPAHSAFVRTYTRRQATPGDGLSRLPGHHPAGREVLTYTHGSCCRAGTAHRSVSLSECEVDSQERARSAAAWTSSSAASSTVTTQQHPRRGVL